MKTKYVTSLELSKQLKEAGVKQESEWYWTNYGNPNKETFYLVSKNGSEIVEIQQNFEFDGFKEEIYSAFHVGELGEMLPKYLRQDKEYFYLQTSLFPIDISTNNFWIAVSYQSVRNLNKEEFAIKGAEIPAMTADNEAEARGKMVLYLKENKLI